MFRKIANTIGKIGFFINEEGVVKTVDSLIIKPDVKLSGCTVRLNRSVKKLSNLMEEHFPQDSDVTRILRVLESVDWIWTTRLMWRLNPEGAGVRVKVLFQSGGPMDLNEFTLSSEVDAKLIFEKGSVYRNRWTRSYIPPRKRIGN